MIVWFALLIPIISGFFLLKFYEKKMIWWEFIIPVSVTIITIFVSKAVVEMVGIQDTEFHTGYAVQARYYEDWNEKVSCSHPKYCNRTESYRYSCGTTDHPRTCTGTRNERYQCGHQHSYDVDYHPAYWEMEDNNGYEVNISKDLFIQRTQLWNNKSFKDLHRDYHTNDGDLWYTNFDEIEEHMDVLSFEFSYPNRVAATNNVFSFQEVSSEDKKKYGLFDYPAIKNHVQEHLLGYSDPEASRILEILNAKLGKPKKVKVFVLVYTNQPLTASVLQEALWKGGNKNELVLTVGIDSEAKVEWARAFSWTDRKIAVIESNDLLVAQIGNKLDTKSIIPKLQEIVIQSFEKKNFHDFDYITVEPSPLAICIVFLIVIFTNIGCAAFVIKNGFVPQ